MEKNGQVVVKETIYIAKIVVILSLLTNVVFLCCGIWDYTVLLGNILSASFAVLNFYLMGKSVQKAVTKDEKEARSIIKTSQSMRQIMLLAVVAIGALVPIFSIWTTIIPLLFPRIAVAIRPLFGNIEQYYQQ